MYRMYHVYVYNVVPSQLLSYIALSSSSLVVVVVVLVPTEVRSRSARQSRRFWHPSARTKAHSGQRQGRCLLDSIYCILHIICCLPYTIYCILVWESSFRTSVALEACGSRSRPCNRHDVCVLNHAKSIIGDVCLWLPLAGCYNIS